MVTYEIRTKKFDYGNNTFENALNDLRLKIRHVKTGYKIAMKKIPDVEDSLIYEVERKEELTIEENSQIMCMDGIIGIKKIQ